MKNLILSIAILATIALGCGDTSPEEGPYEDPNITFGVNSEAASEASTGGPITVDYCSYAWTSSVVRGTVDTPAQPVGACENGTEYEPHWMIELVDVDTIAGEDLGSEIDVRLNESTLVGEPRPDEQLLLSIVRDGQQNLVRAAIYIGPESSDVANERGLGSEGSVDVQLSSDYEELKQNLADTWQKAGQLCSSQEDGEPQRTISRFTGTCEGDGVSPNNSSPNL